MCSNLLLIGMARSHSLVRVYTGDNPDVHEQQMTQLQTTVTSNSKKNNATAVILGKNLAASAAMVQ